jgi:YD repeat-containing protein
VPDRVPSGPSPRTHRPWSSGNRIAALTLASAGGQGQDVPLVVYRHDEAGNVSEIINSSGQPLRFCYDTADSLAGRDDRNGFSYRYYYGGQDFDLVAAVVGDGQGSPVFGVVEADLVAGPVGDRD